MLRYHNTIHSNDFYLKLLASEYDNETPQKPMRYGSIYQEIAETFFMTNPLFDDEKKKYLGIAANGINN
jgi:hypothetical protein